MRIGGFDQIVANVTSGGTSSGEVTRMLWSALRSALRAHSSRARALTSIAHTVAPGDRLAIVSAIGPAPQPRSRR